MHSAGSFRKLKNGKTGGSHQGNGMKMPASSILPGSNSTFIYLTTPYGSLPMKMNLPKNILLYLTGGRHVPEPLFSRKKRAMGYRLQGSS